ncbi:MAG: MoaD/ThiS family protein [Capsulimonadaceae bacterium]|nr:MoaD/ThiS family protein [Capsulimonadaceae bacterium]
MAISILIPSPMRRFTEDQDTLTFESATTVDDILAQLVARYPDTKRPLRDDAGNIRRSVNIYVNDEDIRFLQNKDTVLKDGDSISIVPAIAGG